MLEVFLTTVKSYFMIVDSITKTIQYANEYRDYIINIVIVVAAFFVGKASRAGNQFDQYLQQFGSSSKDEVLMRTKIALNSKTTRLVFLGYFVFVFVLLLLWAYKNRTLLVSETLSLDDLLNDLKEKSYNQYILTTFFTSVFVLGAAIKYFAYVGSELQDRLDKMSSNKYLYVERFFSIIGAKMKDEIRRCLLKETEPSVLKIDLISEENQKSRTKLKELYMRLDGLERTELMYQKFVLAVLEFNWCLKCYDEQNNPIAKPILEGEKSELSNAKRLRVATSMEGSETKAAPEQVELAAITLIKAIEDPVKIPDHGKISQESNTEVLTHVPENILPKAEASFSKCTSNCLPKFYLHVQRAATETSLELQPTPEGTSLS
jgi:hypothetical protein